MILKSRSFAGIRSGARMAVFGALLPCLAFVACGGGNSAPSIEGPSITSQPGSVSTRSTQPATFAVAVKGQPAPTFVWQKNGVAIPGAVAVSYTIPATNILDAGDYRVVVSNQAGVVTSNTVTLEVKATLLFNAPGGMAIDGSGNTYLANSGEHTICKIQPNGDVTVLAGAPGQPGHVDATGATARFTWPTGLAIDGSGTLYVADGNNTIRVVSPSGVVTTLAGSAGLSGTTNGTGGAARFGSLLQGLTWDGSGNLLVADTYNHTIRMITTSGVVTTVAGLPGQLGATNGTLAVATFNQPSGVAVDAAGTLYVSDYGNSVIRAISTGGTVSTFAGIVGTPGSVDGAATTATFNGPSGIVMDGTGRLFVADTLGHIIRKVETTGAVSTFAGGAAALGNLDGTGTAARFNRPSGLALGPSGSLLVADTNNREIRTISSAAVVTTYTKP